jgi:hypothetical protein
MVSNDPAIFQEFREALGTHDPKTIATYLATMRDFVAWLFVLPDPQILPGLVRNLYLSCLAHATTAR